MNVPKDLFYTASHEWIKFNEDGSAMIGLTDFAQSSLGDIVFINLPEEGDDISVGESFSDVESVKAVSDVYSPVTGKVASVNSALADSPELINQDPYEAWLIQADNIVAKEDLLTAEQYIELIAKEA